MAGLEWGFGVGVGVGAPYRGAGAASVLVVSLAIAGDTFVLHMVCFLYIPYIIVQYIRFVFSVDLCDPLLRAGSNSISDINSKF